jgi:hypothetical protein
MVSIRRLIAAAVLATCCSAAVITVASAAGLSLNLGLGTKLGLPPLGPSALPTLPGASPTPSLCVTNCAPAPPGSHTTGQSPGSGTGTTTGPGAPKGPGSWSSSSSAVAQGRAASQSAPAALSTVGSPHSATGLSLAGPPPVEQLTPLAGISFGEAPYLWPIFALLDVIAAAAVVLVVRKTWSRAPGAD